MKAAIISAEVDSELISRAAKVFRKIGISESEAIVLFLREVVSRQQLPFDSRLLNQTTFDTMRKTDAGEELTAYKDVNDFYREMGM